MCVAVNFNERSQSRPTLTLQSEGAYSGENNYPLDTMSVIYSGRKTATNSDIIPPVKIYGLWKWKIIAIDSGL